MWRLSGGVKGRGRGRAARATRWRIGAGRPGLLYREGSSAAPTSAAAARRTARTASPAVPRRPSLPHRAAAAPAPRGAALLALVLLALLLPGLAVLSAPARAAGPEAGPGRAEAWYLKGFKLQQEFHTLEALKAYQRALELDPFHARAHYEIGWSYWILENWPEVVRHWELAKELGLKLPELDDYLAMARERLSGKLPPLERPPLHTRASGGGVTLELVARFQHYDPSPADPADHFDEHVFSPKSVQITPDGAKAYVQALEGHATIVYDARRRVKLKAILHSFGPEQAGLFDAAETAAWAPRFPAGEAPADFNVYEGKPVEGVFTHGGRYLWVSHYRRSYDALGILPSSVAIIDTRTDAIVRVMQSGPIPKFMAASPDGHWLAVVHWGDNTVGVIDIRGDDPHAWHHVGEITVEHKLSLDLDRKVDRDRYCGLCLRGAVFLPDSRTLLVARMGGGGIAVLDVEALRTIGSVQGMKPTPRHLLLSRDGQTLYVGSNSSGYVATYRAAELAAAARAGTPRLRPLREVRSGAGTRTIALSPDGRLLFAAVNQGSQVLVLDAHSLRRLVSIPTDSFPVGLAVAPDGGHVWVTAQGRKLRGGNAVSVYAVTRAPAPAP
jgi:DNA-binding beta-propeller fold protein YncE